MLGLELPHSTLRHILEFAVDVGNCFRLSEVCHLWREIIAGLSFWADHLHSINAEATLISDELSWRDAWIKRNALRRLQVDSWEQVEVRIAPNVSDVFSPRDFSSG